MARSKPAKVPRYTDLQPASRLASDIKKRNRSRDTRAEMLLRRALWKLGVRYRLHDSRLPGKPDIIIAKARVIIFCDGDFWHGRNWRSRKAKLARGANAAYWLAKIETNIQRDRKKTRALEQLGWTVLRFWETDILRDPQSIAESALSTVLARSEWGQV